MANEPIRLFDPVPTERGIAAPTQDQRATSADSQPPPQALVLAAGRGSRLGACVESHPKCLLTVGGRSLLDHQLDALAMAGIDDVCVVGGYHYDVLAQACQGRADIVRNANWSTTNSLYSFCIARDWVKRDVIVLNCDVLAAPPLFSRLLATRTSAFTFDSSSGDDDEHMKVELEGCHLRSMSKVLPADRVHGENVGILYFTRQDARLLFEKAASLATQNDNKLWLASAVQQFARSRPFLAVDVADLPWVEIDYAEDLALARSKTWPSIQSNCLVGTASVSRN